jgi:hypothetical protein
MRLRTHDNSIFGLDQLWDLCILDGITVGVGMRVFLIQQNCAFSLAQDKGKNKPGTSRVAN